MRCDGMEGRGLGHSTAQNTSPGAFHCFCPHWSGLTVCSVLPTLQATNSSQPSQAVPTTHWFSFWSCTARAAR